MGFSLIAILVALPTIIIGFFSKFEFSKYILIPLLIALFGYVDYKYLKEFINSIREGMSTLPKLIWFFLLVSILLGAILGPILISGDYFLPFQLLFYIPIPDYGILYYTFFGLTGGLCVLMGWGVVFKVYSIFKRRTVI